MTAAQWASQLCHRKASIETFTCITLNNTEEDAALPGLLQYQICYIALRSTFMFCNVGCSCSDMCIGGILLSHLSLGPPQFCPETSAAKPYLRSWLLPADCVLLAAQAFSQVIDQVDADPYLHSHLRYYVREVRVVAYSQVSLPATCTLSLDGISPMKCAGLMLVKMHYETFTKGRTCFQQPLL